MPIGRDSTAAQATAWDIDPEIMMQGSPFAIPERSREPRAARGPGVEPGDLLGFVVALGLIFGLVAILGVSL